MKKYNLSKIMKKAWEYVRKLKMTISSALKKSWMEEKMEKLKELKGSPKQIKWANDIRKKAIELATENNCREILKLIYKNDEASWFIDSSTLRSMTSKYKTDDQRAMSLVRWDTDLRIMKL